jgi:3-oxoacyl-[acyl-carrier-protein] synthase II
LSAGLVNAEQTADFDRRLDLRDLGRSSRWATVAAKLALREAQYPEQSAKLSELGLFLNLSAGPSEAETEFLTSYLQNQHRVGQILAFPFIVPSSVAGEVCRTLRLTGHNLTLSAGPGAGLIGLAPAFSALRAGHLKAALCGAVDELTDRILTDHYLAGRLNDSTREPPGEGAAWLVLETASQARQRGATPLAWISGLAFATDTAQARLPNASVQSITEVVRTALAQAQAGIDELAGICLHGPRPRLAQAIEVIIPHWREKLVDVSPITGCLEGAQPLLDLSIALLTPAQELVRLLGKRCGKPGLAPGQETADGTLAPRDEKPATGPTAPPARPFVLALSSSPSGVHCAFVFRKN